MRHSGMSVSALCRLFGVSRQGYYQYEQFVENRSFTYQLIISEVQELRKLQPRVGGRKMFVMLQTFFAQHQIKIGRDVFFDLLSEHHLLVRMRKRRYITTYSKHPFKKYPNLIKDLLATAPHQVWVGDITYVPIQNNFAYLSLLTDGYSRKIVGWYLSADLCAYGCVQSLSMALKQKPQEAKVIHHSDRGIQYCSGEYVGVLCNEGVVSSMTDAADPYQNAIAERVNGILKTELLLEDYATIDSARAALVKAVMIYNYHRLHSSCDLLTPAQAHQQEGILKKHWKNYYKRKEAVMT
jgi:putative transposase